MNPDSILNFDTINSLKDILDDDLNELFIEFRNVTQTTIESLKKAELNNDYDEILHLSHSIKGAAGNLGLSKVSNLAQQLESGLRQKSISDSLPLITDIESAYNETISELITRKLLAE